MCGNTSNMQSGLAQVDIKMATIKKWRQKNPSVARRVGLTSHHFSLEKKSNRKIKKEGKEVKYCSELWGHICNGLLHRRERKSVSFASPIISTIAAPITKKNRQQLRILPDFLLTYPSEWQHGLVHADSGKLQFKTSRSRFRPATVDPITYCVWHLISEQTSGGCKSGGRAFSADATGSRPWMHT